MPLILYYYSELMNLHSFNSDVTRRPNGIPDVKKGKQAIIFPFEETCDVSWIRQQQTNVNHPIRGKEQ